MNIHELSLRSRVPIKTLRRLEALKVLKIDAEPDMSAALRFHLRRNKTLPVAYLLALIDDPSLVSTLGGAADKARDQLDLLGNFNATSAPPGVTAYIMEAGRNDSAAVKILVDWAKSVLPRDPVPYSWLAVRLLAPLPASLRDQCLKLSTMALLRMRQSPEFAGYWQMGKVKGRNVMFYHAPQQAGFDL